MIRLAIPGGSYTECWPDLSYVAAVSKDVVHPDGSRGVIPHARVQVSGRYVPEPPEPVLHLRGDGRGQVAGQGHVTGALQHWVRTDWHVGGPVCGVNGVIFAPDGELLVNDHCQHGTQGFRCFDDGALLTGDDTYQGEVAEWTRQGDVTIGQSYVDGVGAVILYGGLRKQLEPGHCTFVRFNRVGSQCAVALWKQPEDRSVCCWFDVSEIAALPNALQSPPPLPPEPPPMATIPYRAAFVKEFLGPRLKRLDTTTATRAHSFEQVNALVTEMRKTDARWGLLEAKPPKANVRERAADIALYRISDEQAQVVDVVKNSEGADGKPPEPYWQIKDIRSLSQWREPYPIAGPQPEPEPEPGPEPEPEPEPQPGDVTLGQVLAAVQQLQRRFDQHFK